MNKQKQEEIRKHITKTTHRNNLGDLLNNQGYFNYRLEKYGDSKEMVIEEISKSKDWDSIDFVVSFLRRFGIEGYSNIEKNHNRKHNRN